MGTFADSLFTVLLGWVRGLVNGLWALFNSDHTTLLEFFGKNWLIIAAAIVAAGLVFDWIIWLLRWQPYHLWAQRARRLLRMEEPEEEAAAQPMKAHAAAMPRKKSEAQLDESMEIEGLGENLAAKLSYRTSTVQLSGGYHFIEALEREDVSLFVDVSGLSAGKHTVPVQIRVDNAQEFTCALSVPEVIVTITQK